MMKVLANLASGKGSFSFIGKILLFPLDHSPIHMTSFNFNDLEAPPPNIATARVRNSTCGF